MHADDWTILVAVLRRVLEDSNRSIRQAAIEMEISPATLNRIVNEATDLPHPRTRRIVATWVAEEVRQLEMELDPDALHLLHSLGPFASHALPDRPDEAAIAEGIIADPNTLRRALGVIDPSHVKTRIAIIREFEDMYIEAGYGPSRWPKWFNELRRQVYEAAGERSED